MSTITLNNRVTSYSDSDAAFASCTALPIQQTTLNIEEMVGIDGLWDWEDCASVAMEVAVVTAVGSFVQGARVGAVAGAAAGGIPGAIFGVLSVGPLCAMGGAVTGALAGVALYTYREMNSE